MQQQQQQQISINPKDTTAIKCESCENEIFVEGFMLKKISAILSPSGREEMFNIPVPLCSMCGKPFMGEKEI